MNTSNEKPNTNEDEKKIVRVWCDGCYDMVHFGHANSLRQAKSLGDHLVVGIHSDEEILKHKGPPVFNQDERYQMLKAIRWVDEVVCDAPYVTTIDILNEYDCEFCAHGNDITTTADGKDTYQEVKDAKRYKEVQRTQGVSTTDLVGRMLRLTNTNKESRLNSEKNADSKLTSPYTGKTEFLCTTKKIIDFAKGKAPEPGARIVYVAGAFDVLHPGHLGFLEAARKLGDYLIVGLHSDPVVNSYKGSNYPIVKLNERVMSILAVKYVDDVIMGAPFLITDELIQSLNISIVAHGQIPIFQPSMDQEHVCPDPYHEAKKQGIYLEIESGSTLTTAMVVERITQNKQLFEDRNSKKEKKEIAMLQEMPNNNTNEE